MAWAEQPGSLTKKLLTNNQIYAEVKKRLSAKSRDSLLDFTLYTNPTYETGWFNELLCKELDQFLKDVEAGLMPRLMIFAPPRSGKSELASRRFPASIIGKHPDWNVISTSYSADLSNRMSRDVQRIMEGDQYKDIYPNVRLKLKGENTAAIRTAELWEAVTATGSVHGGSYRAAGVNGGITGQGMNVGIIDDPAKDYKQASSNAYQVSVKDWYDTTFYTRIDPKKNGIIIIATRWHKKDLAGQLLEEAANGGEQWRIVSFPMEAEENEQHELAGTKYNLREKGEILFPERMPANFVELCKSRGSLVWNALYQQRPTVSGGGLIKTEWFGEYSVLPPLKYHTVIGDTAQKTKEANDYSVFQHWGLAENGNLYLIDQVRGKWESDELKKRATAFWIKSAALENGRCRWMGIEDKSSGTGLIQQIRNSNIPKIPVREIPRGTDKFTRLMDVQGYIQSGYVKLPKEAIWLNDFLVECEGISPDFKTHDDQVDPMMDAIMEMLHQKKSSMFDAV